MKPATSTSTAVTKLTTLLSVAGVLGAGTAAAVVNTQILDGDPQARQTSAAVLPPATAVQVTVPGADATAQPAEVTLTVPPAPPASGLLTAFTVGTTGTVTVDVIGGRVVLVKAEPSAGWTLVSTTESPDGSGVDVVLADPATQIAFRAALIDGRLVPTVHSTALATTTTAVTTTTPPETAATTVATSVAPDDTVTTGNTVTTTPRTTTPRTTIDDDDDDATSTTIDDDDDDDDDDGGGNSGPGGGSGSGGGGGGSGGGDDD